MSKLYVRVMTGFYTHRKTARLRAAIGDDAFWVPPRLWAYAAENQPDGDMGQYDSGELAMLLGCYKHSSSILQALKDSGFVEPDGKIHDWAEHNGYHEKYSTRAKAAAEARWKKKPEAQKEEAKEETGKGKVETSIACSMLIGLDEAFDKFWEAYPLKKAKADALVKFKAKGCSRILPQILSALEAQKQSHDWTKDGGQYIPLPSTYINQARWLDDVSTYAKPTSNNQQRPNRNIGTANEGNHTKYIGLKCPVGGVAGPANIQ